MTNDPFQNFLFDSDIHYTVYHFARLLFYYSVKETKVDMHPEKRVKAAYTDFESRRLPQLKAENPNLRLSQLKQMLKKEWQKSPENPLNARLMK